MSTVLDTALKDLRIEHAQGNGDGFLFSGNRHETVPRSLLLDTRLTPLERNAWQVFRLLLNEDGVTAFPTYEQLRSYLACVPCGAQASHESVAKTLTVLRLTRWLSLARRRRDSRTGRVQGNLYVLHDRPLTPFEAMQIDPEYMVLVSNTLKHPNKGVQRVGLAVLEEIGEDPGVQTRLLPSHLQVLTASLYQQPFQKQQSETVSEVHDLSPLTRKNAQPSETELGRECPESGSLRHPKTASTLSKKALKKLRTAEGSHQICELQFPARFKQLTPTQQAGAKVALLQLTGDVRQQVLDEWAMRCRDSQVRNPAGYLFGIIQKALQGHFTAWAAKDQRTEPPVPPPRSNREPKAERDPSVAHAHLNVLKGLLHLR
ncbi:STY4528 family pathogenicity island replication protein [Pseudomonas sp. lyk4-TYG-107]|uniref:STY4528 family pathogenicity island replication protein n=1 Tax=Pseudomonas sp. lyk4-TYG-107 TaxID=3040317 RepID=UPI002553D3E3|nr:STY4528 family pathogenicity island replication protein [Pseudomonas sp. lyk4-TYG-107]